MAQISEKAFESYLEQMLKRCAFQSLRLKHLFSL